MKQIILLSIPTIFISMVGIKTHAHDISVKNADGVTINYNWTNNKTELAVTYYGSDYRSNQTQKYSGNIVIPEVVIYDGKSYNVTSIGSNAFWNCSDLTSIHIPNSVKEIGLGAFSSCTGLTSITIPNSITKLEGKYYDGVFYGCTNLISINIPNSVTSIGNYVFSGCKSLRSINIPNSVKSIGDYAFSSCLSLLSIEIPNSIVSIGDRVFKNCKGLISITFGNGLESIGICAFSGCTNLKKVIVKNIAAWCNINFKTGSYSDDDYSPNTSNPLYYTHHLYSDENTEIQNLVIPNGVTSISNRAFQNCLGINSIIIPNSVTSIGRDAFEYCYGLESIEFHCQKVDSWFKDNPYILEVTFGDEVTNIGNNAFQYCKGLTSITIPKNITSIGDFAFQGCNLIKVIWLPSEYQKVNGIININSSIYPHLDTAFEINGIKYVIVNPSTRTCDAIDCIKNKTVENITLENNVSYRGLNFKIEKCKAIFIGNQFVKNVKLNLEGETGDYQFYGCKKLEKVELGNQITSIGSSVFENCSSLNSVTIPNSVTSIADKTFINCSNLKSITIPNSVTSIGYSAFQDCTSLTSVTMSNNITSINYSTFYGCTALTSVNIPEFVTSISHYAFYGCSELPNINIPNSVTSIGDYTFSNCYSLTSITIPNSVTSIGELAFQNCTSLLFGSIGENVSSIGRQAFYGCTGITKLICKAMTPPYCNYKALYDIDKWNCTLSVPEGSITAYQQADQWKDFFFIDNDMTKIKSLTNESINPIYIYNMNGQKRQNTKPGLNIIKMNYGTTKKVIIK